MIVMLMRFDRLGMEEGFGAAVEGDVDKHVHDEQDGCHRENGFGVVFGWGADLFVGFAMRAGAFDAAGNRVQDPPQNQHQAREGHDRNFVGVQKFMDIQQENRDLDKGADTGDHA